MIGSAVRADAGAFLARLNRLDPTAVVRLKPAPDDRTEMWAMLPFGVLVRRTLDCPAEGDQTVAAAALLAALAADSQTVGSEAVDSGAVDSEAVDSGAVDSGAVDSEIRWPPRDDTAWRWSLPGSSGYVIERLPVADVVRVAQAASRTLRDISTRSIPGRSVGQRAMRDALLDHVPFVVTGERGERIAVKQRLIQAVVQMGFIGSWPPQAGVGGATFGDAYVAVRFASAWIGLTAMYGCAWYRETSPMPIQLRG